ncbi:MAG TPA: response regulator [Desulfobulbaceae bacterium]|nr:response regulator [Desulfobulbaceae bacterium]
MIKVMIVDDEVDFAEALVERLQLRDFEVRHASSAEAAMSNLRNGWTPNVILLDLKMPGLNGLETLLLIKKHSPGIEVILVTGDGSTSAGMEGMHMGLFDYLMKPIDIGVIVERINKAAAKNKNG